MNIFNLSWSCLHDPLSLFFIVLILLVALPAAIYSVGYCRHMDRVSRLSGGLAFVLFIASMLAVVTAGNALFFLVAWEVMSLLSYYLIVAGTENASSVRAGALYIVMTHLATACITVAFLLMYQYTGSFEFSAMKEACRLMPAHLRSLVFVLLLTGFGTKAGMVPLHIWLPAAHPAAPSHVSAAMSGVMIKMGIYGLIRFIPGTLGAGPSWWGNTLLTLGALSCFTGIMFALTGRNLKRILAFSSIENIGIILLAFGASLVCASRNMPGAAAFALAAGLFHTANHAVFKSLLFLGAGSVVEGTGTKNIEQYGGLVRKMPRTALAFFIGAMAIAAIPPLNGFAGEWLILQSFFRAASEGTAAFKYSMPLAAAILALTGGLAAACFVRVFGITFLGMPRSHHAANAVESPSSMTIPMFFLAFMAAAMGLGAPYFFGGCLDVSSSVLGFGGRTPSGAFMWFISGAGKAVTSPLVIAGVLAVFTGIALFVSRLRAFRRDRIWGCGYYSLGPDNEYTGTAFSKPFRLSFSFMLRPYRRTETIREATYHVKSFKYEVHTTSMFKGVYDRAIVLLFAAARQLRRLQPGSIHLYIGYIFITMLALILFMHRF